MSPPHDPFWDSYTRIVTDECWSTVKHICRVLLRAKKWFQAYQTQPSVIWNMTWAMREHQRTVTDGKLVRLGRILRVLRHPVDKGDWKAKLGIIEEFCTAWEGEERFIEKSEEVYDELDPRNTHPGGIPIPALMPPDIK